MRVKGKDGALVSSGKVTGVRKRHFKHLMNKETAGEGVVQSMGKEAGGNWVFVQG